MIETQVRRRQPPRIEFMRDIARAEYAGGEPDEGIEDDEDNVEIVDEQIGSRRRPLEDEERQRRRQGRQCRGDVEAGRSPVVGEHGEQARRNQRNEEDENLGIVRHRRQCPSPR